MSSIGSCRSIAVIATLLLISLPGTRALADDESRVNPVVATTVESVVALVTSCGFGLGEFEMSGAADVFVALVTLQPVGTAATMWLTGRWLEPGAGFGWTTLGAYAGLVTGIGLDALAAATLHPSYESGSTFGIGIAVPCVTTAVGAVLGYKLGRAPQKAENLGFRLDPPSLALSLKPAKPNAPREIAGVRLNLLSARF